MTTTIVIAIGGAIILLLLITTITCAHRAHRQMTQRNKWRTTQPRGTTRQSQW